MTKSIRVGLIGLGGHMVRSLLPNIFANPDIIIASATDLNSENREVISANLPGVPIYESAQDLFEKKEQDSLDAVIIAVDPSGHEKLTREALKHGLHVFVEKPATSKDKSLTENAQLAKETGLQVFVGTMWRYVTSTKLLRERMADKKLVSISIDAAFPGVFIRDGWDVDLLEVALYDMFIHPIDYALFWAGESNQITFKYTKSADNKVIAASITMEGGALVNLHLTSGTTGYQTYASLHFDDGTHAQIYDMKKLIVNPPETWTGTTGTFRDRPEMTWDHGNLYRGYARHGYAEELRAFVDCVRGQGQNLSDLNQAELTMTTLSRCLDLAR